MHTVMSGAVTERATVWTYSLMSVLMSSFIYPVIIHWAWSDFGWLANGGSDFRINGTDGIGFNVRVRVYVYEKDCIVSLL